MKVKVYVSWNDQVLLNEAEYAEWVNDAAKEMEEEGDALADFLDDNYSSVEIFDFNEEDKARVWEEFREKCKKMAEEDLGCAFEMIEKEI